MSVAFDTLGAARSLEAAGIERKHAEAIAQAIHHGDERAATKADLAALRTELRGELATLRSELRADLYRALWIQGIGIIAILSALRFLPL